MQLHCDLQGGENRSQWNCCFKMMFGGEKSDETFCFLASNGSSCRCGEPCLCNGCGLRAFAVKRVLDCRVKFRCVDRSGMAAYMLRIAMVVDAVVLWFSRPKADRTGVAASGWCLEARNRTKPCASRMGKD